MSIPASTIRNEFQGFMQKLGPPAQDVHELLHCDERTLSSGDSAIITSGAFQYTTTLKKVPIHHEHPYTGTGDGWDYYTPVSEPGGPLHGDLHIVIFLPDAHWRAVDVNYKKVGEALTRDVEVSTDKTTAENVLTVGPGDDVARESNASTSQDQIASDLLTPDEKAILGEWNLTSLA